MDPHFQDEEIAVEIKVFPAIRTLRFWILTKYLKTTDFFIGRNKRYGDLTNEISKISVLYSECY